MAVKRKADPVELRHEEEEEEEEEDPEEEEDEEIEEDEEEDAEKDEETPDEIAAEAQADQDDGVVGRGGSEEDDIKKLLEPFTKEQLRDILRDAALKDEGILDKIRKIAEKDVSHRKIFVRGLGWDTNADELRGVFEKYGEIEDCTVVMDRASGKSKGYGFVTYRRMEAAQKSLEEPSKKVGNRMAACQLASMGPTGGSDGNNPGRKIYVSNVPADVSAEKLLKFFSRFGEIEEGPLGFDKQTGKSKGYALFVYKTVEGAKKALEEPNKNVEGYAMHCKWAAGGQKPKTQNTPTPVAGTLDPNDLALTRGAGSLLGAAAAAQAFNPLLAAQTFNPALLGSINPALASSFNPAAFGASAHGAMNQGVLGVYGSQSATGLQGFNPYQAAPQQFGNASLATAAGRTTGQPGTGSYGGVNPYMSR